MFIGREQELAFLNSRYEDSNGQLIVLYGRRRIGKTETLREFCKDKPHIFFSCQECTDKLQLKNFSKKLLNEDIPAKKYIREFNDWEQAFHTITELPHPKKKLIVIDEFPYMCKNNSSIPSVLQNLWDHKLKDQNIMIILCGSSMSFIEKELLADKNPLYGRATGIYKMKEMNFYDAIKFFPDTYTYEEKIIAYSILGGIPHYLKQFHNQMSLEENIKLNILSKGCVLFNEVEFLLHQELRETSIYNAIIESIALGNTKLNEISQSSLIASASKTSVYLKNLVELGIVERELSIQASSGEIANLNRGIYQLTDHYFRFWYTFIFQHYSEIEDGDVDGVFTYIIQPELQRFASYTFEKICMQYTQRRQRENTLPFRYEKIGHWFGKTTIRDTLKPSGHRIDESEIDVLALSNKDKSLLVGECKFKNQPFQYSEYLDTQAKLTPLKEKNTFYYMLFSKSGFDTKLIELSKSDPNIILIDLEKIFD